MTRLGLALALVLLVPVASAERHLARVDGVRVEPGNQILRITWTASTDPAIAGYYVFVYAEGRLIQRLNATEPLANFRGAVNERPYAVVVAGHDAQGNAGPPSLPVGATPTLRHDQTYLALGLLVLWFGLWSYTWILARIERRLQDQEVLHPRSPDSKEKKP